MSDLADQQVVEYTLSEKQQDFILSDHRFAGYGGGVGNGKSFAGCIKAFRHCDEQPGAFFLIGRRHATDLRDSTLKDFLFLFEQEGVYKEKTNTFRFPNGSEIIFRHLDDLKSLTNMNLSGFWIDQAEEVPEDAFIFLVGRLRRKVNKREGFITFNMNGHDWIWRRFKMGKNPDGETLTNRPDYFLTEATSMENKHLPEDYIKSILSMPKDWVNRFVHGSWDTFAGQIFDEWNEGVHVVKPFKIPDGWERFRGIDHGQSHPTCCLWGAIDYVGNIFIYREYYEPEKPVSYHVENIQALSEDEHYSYTVIDPSTHAKTREKDGWRFSVADEYLDAGIATIKAQNDVMAGINRVKEYLKIDWNKEHPVNTINNEFFKGAPRLFIFENCYNLIEEIPQYKWKPQRYGAEDRQKEQPVKNKDDAVDVLRYLIMSRPLAAERYYEIPAWVFSSPIELARYAQEAGKTVDDLIADRFRHKQHGVTHTGSIRKEGFVQKEDRRQQYI